MQFLGQEIRFGTDGDSDLTLSLLRFKAENTLLQTNSTAWQLHNSGIYTLRTGWYRIGIAASWSFSSGTYDARVRCVFNNSTIWESRVEPKDTDDDQMIWGSGFSYEEVTTQGDYEIRIECCSSSRIGTIRLQRSVFELWRVQ
jgi:hypothetical protein